MWKVRDSKDSKKYRCFSPSTMFKAMDKVRDFDVPIKTTAREFGIPESSLRHKLSGRVNPDATRSGPSPMFSMEEEAHFIDHVKFMAACGYGYSRAEVVDMASEYAVCLGKRDKDHPLSFRWYSTFMSRWPELKVLKPRDLEFQRAKATTVDTVSKYYLELGSILDKYDLKDSPERIYNVDEKGLSTQHKPPFVVTSADSKPPAVTTGSRTTVTVIGCGNALGCTLPPFFVFPGKKMRQELLDAKSPGADGDVSESGWSNSVIFRRYIEDHLMKYLPERSAEKPVLVLYDGHRSHINLGLIDWAKSHHLVLFILPAHTSHVLQPLDIGCFGTFERIYNNISHKFMREHCGPVITHNVCSIACSAYGKALSPENLQASFRKAGIYPFDPNVVDPSNFKPSDVLQQETCEAVIGEKSPSEHPSAYFASKEAKITARKPPTKKRRYLSTLVSGKAINENSMIDTIRDHENAKGSKKPLIPKPVTMPLPGPSEMSKSCSRPVAADSDSPIDELDSSELCCVCKLFTPAEVRHSTSLVFVKSVQCSKCGHWVHLSFCTKVKIVRRGDVFLCPHCMDEE